MTRDTISKFNRDTLWLATGVLGTVVFAALMLAFQERQPKATQAEGDLLLNANPATVAGVVSKSSNDKMASGEGSGVDHAFIETPPQEIPSSQTESAASTPVLALTPENRNAAQANPDSGTSALRQDSARSIGPEARNARNRSSVASRSIDVKRRLIQLWHQSLAIAKKSRSWTAFSNLNRGVNKKAAYTAETNR